jgi:hypothetical protein
MSFLKIAHGRKPRLTRRHTRIVITGSSALLVILLLILARTGVSAGIAHASFRAMKAARVVNSIAINPGVEDRATVVEDRATVKVAPTIQVHDGRLAPTVKVLDALPPTTILQFPLVPSGIKALFPKATGLVTIVRGSRIDSPSDTVTLDVQHMPPNITFTVFFIQIADKPFGNVQYVADLTTRGDGSGETIFQVISFVAFAMDARNPGTSRDGQEGLTSGTNLEHLGMWFASLQDAQKALNNSALKGTIFDGGNPPLHAGPQAMTDGQSAPVF